MSAVAFASAAAVRAEAVYSTGEISRREASGVHRAEGAADEAGIRLGDTTAVRANQMEMAGSGYFVAGLMSLEEMSPQQTGTHKQLHGIVDRSAADVVSLILKPAMHLVDTEMGFHIEGHAQNLQTLGSAPHPRVGQKCPERPFGLGKQLLVVVSVCHLDAKLIQKSEIDARETHNFLVNGTNNLLQPFNQRGLPLVIDTKQKPFKSHKL